MLVGSLKLVCHIAGHRVDEEEWPKLFEMDMLGLVDLWCKTAKSTRSSSSLHGGCVPMSCLGPIFCLLEYPRYRSKLMVLAPTQTQPMSVMYFRTYIT